MLRLAVPALMAMTAYALAALAAQPVPSAAASPKPPNPARGASLIAHYGCGACHSIPGIANADGLVGPPLDNIGARTVIAGMLPNTPANLRRWLENPQAVVPNNVMPNFGMSARDAADIAAYLERLRD